ncbi:hypothetical protein CERZMDRAFT_97053 [Cercospora zeae-maydis SCOH1-5]|uniref:F-box domain-containing protein n=1 Tax=Cercospora zeae-maydis SCOH1-5 TaxID=717836 RepID=A0A6A6FGM8_9PEZI|nr:hypothetical protein CERZMDRAFT_97053 [Cercospora zeae-maydis SCOH1-5]
MTFKRHHHEADFTEAHYDCMWPDADPPPMRHAHRRPRPLSPARGPPSIACVRTFHVAELAEEIFLHLPPQTLLCKVQRVCRQWRRTVETSELIRQYLFFQPIPHPCDDVYNRALYYEVPSPDQRANMPILENPWLYLLSDLSNQSKRLRRYHQASWKRMLLTQPSRRYGAPRELLLEDVATRTCQRQPLWSTWEPALSFDTLQQVKKLRRPDETITSAATVATGCADAIFKKRAYSSMSVGQMPGSASFNDLRAIPFTRHDGLFGLGLSSIRFGVMDQSFARM